jgi:glycosyltransferase involved in cell wall biosynthesis
MDKTPLVSVVIPTYNREAVLRRTLGCLVGQSLPADQMEVCVVDDGSSVNVTAVAQESFPFAVRCLRRNRQGATAARNAGALNSRGQVLVFLDDDICPAPQTLEILVRGCQEAERLIMLGTLITPEANKATVFARLNAPSPYAAQAATQDRDVTATDCLTGLLAVRRTAFFELGMFQDPTGGWPNWDDVDFGYRAQQAGYRLRRSARARAEHWDYSIANLTSMCRRWQRASQSAACLLRKYPALEPAMPMFADKRPIVWGVDSPKLVARKLIRRVASAAVIVSVLEWLAHGFEQRWAAEPVLRRLYRWIIGAYIFRGFQSGVKELKCSML